MTKELWINLPVKDAQKAKAFFTAIGFKFHATPTDAQTTACFLIGDKNIVLMLFQDEQFEKFSQHKITDTQSSTEVLFSISVESREEVDELAKKVVHAGGKVFGKPSAVQGWMYGCGFSDLDGHRWNVLFMDYSKLSELSK